MADIPTLLNAIHPVDDGQVITADSYNSIKTCLQAIAGALGGSTGGQTRTITLPANFLPVTGATAWNVRVGFAEDSGSSSDGWIPLSLPEGAVLKSLTAIGLKKNAAPAGAVNLFAIPINAGDQHLLASVNLNSVALNNVFTINVPVNVASSLTGLLTVQNSQFKYVIEANANFSTAAASITIYATQVTYVTP
ncbi:MAG TPA: hypothetical protein VMS37_22655 [Verrucomicrobiae bacterium]|nr:hypothetical protein [Candidatus Acidoferrales bacterium]HXK05221.1 hypothetical protein [Verrucomicrobiae bacterium]